MTPVRNSVLTGVYLLELVGGVVVRVMVLYPPVTGGSKLVLLLI